MKKVRLDDTDIEGMGGISVDEALAQALLRQTPEVQHAIREQAEREGRDVIDVLIDWMEDGRAN